MKSQSLLTIVFVLAAALFLASATVSAALGDEPKLVIVHVVNGLRQGARPLSIDCQSAGDEFGSFELPFGEEFKWRFSNEIWAPAHFFCNFWWDSKTIRLDLYTIKFGVKEGNVWFMANEEGIVVKSDEHPVWLRQCPWGFNSDIN